MKKALSIILSVLVIFSVFSMAVSAADEETGKGIVTVQFIVEDELYQEFQVMPGDSFNKYMKDYPTKKSTETTRYEFKHWSSAVLNEETGTYEPDGKITGWKNLPAVDEMLDENGAPVEGRVITYVAEFTPVDIIENQTFWAFLQTIFERINKIFEYFAKVFEGVFEF